MLNTKQVSDLNNSAEALSENMRLKAENRFFNELYTAEKRAETEGWISSDDVKRRLGIDS